MDNGLISYYETPLTARVRQLRLKSVPVKFRLVVMSSCHIYPLAGHSHEHRTLFRILERFWWTILNKDVDHFIRACAYFQLVKFMLSRGTTVASNN